MEKKKYCTRLCAGHGAHAYDCPYYGDATTPLNGLVVSGREAERLIKEEASFLSPAIERKILEIANEYAVDGAIIPLVHAMRNLLKPTLLPTQKQ